MIFSRKKYCSKVSVTCALEGPIKFLYNCKFDFTAKSLVTNTVVIARVLCILFVSLQVFTMIKKLPFLSQVTKEVPETKNKSLFLSCQIQIWSVEGKNSGFPLGLLTIQSLG